MSGYSVLTLPIPCGFLLIFYLLFPDRWDDLPVILLPSLLPLKSRWSFYFGDEQKKSQRLSLCCVEDESEMDSRAVWLCVRVCVFVKCGRNGRVSCLNHWLDRLYRRAGISPNVSLSGKGQQMGGMRLTCSIDYRIIRPLANYDRIIFFIFFFFFHSFLPSMGHFPDKLPSKERVLSYYM